MVERENGRLRRFFAFIQNWLNKHLFRPKNIRLNPDYARAHRFKNAFIPQEGVDYGWVRTYVRESYGKLEQADQNLDNKAESIIKLLGGGSGLLSIGAIVNLSRLSGWVAVCLLISLVFALAGIVFAARVRVPSQTFLPPSIGWAIRYAEVYKGAAEDTFLAQWHLASEGTRLALRVKSAWVKYATWLAVATLITVALSFVVALGTMDWNDPSRDAGGVSMKRDSDSQRDTAPLPPDPDAAPQSPPPNPPSEPRLQAEPQQIEKAQPPVDPATSAEPQSIQFSVGDEPDGDTSND